MRSKKRKISNKILLKFILDYRWIIGFFVEADKDKSDTLSKKECRDLLRDSFNVEMPDHIFEQMFTVKISLLFYFYYFQFQDADKSKEGLLSAQEFVRFFQLLTRRKDLYEIMIRLCHRILFK
jgi:hypothetical protein